jgi:molecular chaperone IbpA
MNSNLMDTMLARGVGLNQGFFEKAAGASKFPPHDIIQLNMETYRLRLAVAGYTREELKITLRGELLTITGHKEVPPMPTTDDPNVVTKMLYRGIAYRDFTSEFMIGENVRVEQAKLEHGMLDVDLVRLIPENQKLKEIPILV